MCSGRCSITLNVRVAKLYRNSHSPYIMPVSTLNLVLNLLLRSGSSSNHSGGPTASFAINYLCFRFFNIFLFSCCLSFFFCSFTCFAPSLGFTGFDVDFSCSFCFCACSWTCSTFDVSVARPDSSGSLTVSLALFSLGIDFFSGVSGGVASDWKRKGKKRFRKAGTWTYGVNLALLFYFPSLFVFISDFNFVIIGVGFDLVLNGWRFGFRRLQLLRLSLNSIDHLLHRYSLHSMLVLRLQPSLPHL